MKKQFGKFRDIIETYSDNNMLKKLTDCSETMKLLANESLVANPYRLLAYKFLWYNKDGIDDTGDYYFYKFLKKCDNKYTFQLDEEKSITIKINLLNPFFNEKEAIINPQWHLLVSLFAYVDAAFNHDDDEYASQIRIKNNWENKRIMIRNKALLKWMEEAKK